MRIADFTIAALACALIVQSAEAAPAKKAPAKKAVATSTKHKPAAKKSAPVDAVPTTVSRPVGLMVPQAVSLRTMTPDEIQANAIWTLRAGLNVAALQCQFSSFLGTVRTYNDLIKHHSVEIAKAQGVMLAHFKRHDGSKAAAGFDHYSTQTYNSFSTLDAQYSFCETASMIGRSALVLPKGGFGSFAMVRNPELRASLTPPPVASSLFAPAAPVSMPPVDDSSTANARG